MNSLNTDFRSYQLDAALLAAIKQLRYEKATDIQAKAIPAILRGGDVLAGAETGSGKTAAFVLPALQKIINSRKQQEDPRTFGQNIAVLILVPTRELVLQIQTVVEQFAQFIKPAIKCVSVSGGETLEEQAKLLKQGADVLIATPQRLLDLHQQRAMQLYRLHTLILDEADRLTTGNLNQAIESVFEKVPKRCQALLFTATFPDSIRHLVRKVLHKPNIINIEWSEEPSIDEHAILVDHNRKTELLVHLANTYDWQQILVFCNAKKTCDWLEKKLQEQDIDAFALHGDKPPELRAERLESFKQGELSILIATDLAARGVDIPQLPCVINYELPREPTFYIHRIGRTGRAGHKGQALSLIAHHEKAHFKVIEKRNRLVLKRETIEGFEPSSEPPPLPVRNKPKKVAKKKNKKSKKK